MKIKHANHHTINACITSTPENTLVPPATDNATCSSNEMHYITSSEEEKTDGISDERDIISILPKHVKNMLQQFEFTCDDISCLFTEYVTNCQTFMAGMNNLATKYFGFDSMYSKYKSETLNSRNISKLRQKIESILREIKDFCSQLKELSGIILKPSLGLNLLSQKANMKTSLLTNCVILCVKLSSFLSHNDLRSDIRRRISQRCDQSKKGDEIQNMKMECCNLPLT